MRVRDLMTRSPLCLPANSTVRDALSTMVMEEIHQLPIVNEGDLIGIVSERDLRGVLGDSIRYLEIEAIDDDLLDRPITEVMTTDVATLNPDATVADACRDLAELRVGALPVVTDSLRLVGILSVTDVLAEAAKRFEEQP